MRPKQVDRVKVCQSEYIPPNLSPLGPSHVDYPVTRQVHVTDSAQTGPPFQTWKLVLAYDGTGFSGWQIQPGERTIQGELQAALGRVTSESPLPQGSGRTDAGVHAFGQVASFPLQAAIPAENLLRACNRTLPEAIRVLSAETVSPLFHARHSAVSKIYEYRVLLAHPGRGEICPPFLARYVCAYPWPLNFDALQSAADAFVGEHDFCSFAATDPELGSRKADSGIGSVLSVQTETRTTVRKIISSAWQQEPHEAGNMLIYRVRGNGFLHHMVRNLVGTMLDVGRGRLEATEIPAIIAARARSAAGPTAPARGLFLHSVEYREPFEVAHSSSDCSPDYLSQG
jgi:tRNA pseudouridine38-40 synthase